MHETAPYFSSSEGSQVIFQHLHEFLSGNFLPFQQDLHHFFHSLLVLHHDLAGKLIRLLHNHPLADRFTLIRSERTLFEILPKSVNKGVALMKMAELLGIDPDRTIAAGDYYNDVSMLKVAGAGFAVSNAVEEAKQAADYITVSNDENAIAAIIDLLDRGELKI